MTLLNCFLLVAALHAPSVEKVPAQGAESTLGRPTLTFGSATLQNSVGTTYEDALHNLLDINTIRPQTAGAENPVGRLTDPPGTFIRAGGAYGNPWTRDASLNSWFAGSLLEPGSARNTLWAVCQPLSGGGVVIQQDNQWWDQCIWVQGAWNHFAVTGDTKFLREAYPVAVASLALLRQAHYNSAYGLFMGPAFFADGIAAYPPPEFDPANKSSFVLDHPFTSNIMALSTNCVYRQAYRCAAEMAQALQRPASEVAELNEQSEAIKAAINQHLWLKRRQKYAYFLAGAGPQAGKTFDADESMGMAFAILFDVANPLQARRIVAEMHSEPKGVVTLWPSLPQFDPAHLGRHNVMLWPLVNGVWAAAAAREGAVEATAREIQGVSELVANSGHQFFEIYNPQTGVPDGGWQVGRRWDPLSDQTWSATAFLFAIHSGVFGMSFSPQGLRLAPSLPAGWGPVTLSGIRYRQGTLTITLRGEGRRIKRVLLDGKRIPNATIAAGTVGSHSVEIDLVKP